MKFLKPLRSEKNFGVGVQGLLLPPYFSSEHQKTSVANVLITLCVMIKELLFYRGFSTKTKKCVIVSQLWLLILSNTSRRLNVNRDS